MNGVTLTKMASVLTTAFPTGGRHAWLGPLQTHALKNATEGETFANYLRETVLTHLELLREKVKSVSKEIRTSLATVVSRLRKQHQLLQGVISELETIWRIRLRFQDSPTDEDLVSEVIASADIYLGELRLRELSSAFMREKEAYCSILMSSFYQARQMEGELAEGLNSILTEAFMVKEKQMAASGESLAECRECITGAAPLSEWNVSIQKNKLDWDWHVTAPPVDGFLASVLSQISASISSNFPQSSVGLASVRVVRAGFLMKPASFGRWSVIYCVLTDSLYLHCFPPSVFGEVAIEHDEGGKGGKHFRVPSPSLQLHSRSLNELNSAALRIWQATCAASHHIPSLSIPLLHPATSVTADPEYSKGEHVFTITVPGGTSFFGRTEKRYSFRSYLEEDMVDWCIALKDIAGIARTPTLSGGMGASADAAIDIPSACALSGLDRSLSTSPHPAFSSVIFEDHDYDASEFAEHVGSSGDNFMAYRVRSSCLPPLAQIKGMGNERTSTVLADNMKELNLASPAASASVARSSTSSAPVEQDLNPWE